VKRVAFQGVNAVKLPHRRQFLHLAVGAAALPTLPRIARAQTYPARTVRLIVGFAAGGPSDIGARLIGQWLSERFGQPFVIENRPGAGSNVAVEAVVRAAPDGYTLLHLAGTNAQPQFRFHPRYRASSKHFPRDGRDGSQSVVSGEDNGIDAIMGHKLRSLANRRERNWSLSHRRRGRAPADDSSIVRLSVLG
jgi:hypothetical protein